jgi:hypothetical protein
MLIFGYIAVILVAVHSLYSFTTQWNVGEQEFRTVLVVGFCVLVVPMWAIGAAAPSLVDSSADIRADGFHGVEPVAAGGPASGEWMKSHVPEQSSIGSVFWLKSIGEYHAQINPSAIQTIDKEPISGYNIIQPGRGVNDSRTDSVYDNGQVEVIIDP